MRLFAADGPFFMVPYDPSQPLISIHIPKCAGQSFRDVLRRWFGRKLYFHYHNERRNKPPRKVRLKTLLTGKARHGLCIHGHFNHQRSEGVDDYYPGTTQAITILRDPFDAHVSNYFYVKGQARADHRGFQAGSAHPIIANNWNLTDYLEYSPRSFFGAFLPRMTQDDYQEVLRQTFTHIGIAEELQHSVDRLADWLGIPRQTVGRINQSEYDEDIPAGAREKFDEQNALERAVYEFVRSSVS